MIKNGIHYEILGKGESIVLLHGWGGSSRSLEKLQTLLSKNYQVINIDLPGFGDSPEPEDIIGIPEYAKSIVELLDSLKISKFYLFGHSFGGQISGQIVLNYPQKVKAVIFCNAALIRRGTLKGFILGKVSKISKNLGLQFLTKVLFSRSDYQKASPQMKQIMKVILKQDLTEKLSQISTPTLILWGEDDTLTPVQQAFEIKQSIKDSKLITFPNIRHNLPLMYPEKVVDEVTSFIKELKK